MLAATGPAPDAIAAGFAPQDSEFSRSMNQPVEPFHMVGNLYYVGANSVAAYLLTSASGHVLIDGGFAETADMIIANIAELGFSVEDVSILLNSHAHFDHAGGLAALKAASGAELWVSAADADLIERGGLGDPLMGDEGAFPAVQVDHRFEDGARVALGPIELSAHVTAGHTAGCTSWDFSVPTDTGPLRAVSICSLSVFPGAQFGNDPTYPGIREDYESSLATLRALPVDIFLASHATFFRIEDKRARLAGAPATNPFVDPAGYHGYLDRAEAAFRAALAEQGLQ